MRKLEPIYLSSQPPEVFFHAHGGQLRMSDALKLVISRYHLYRLGDAGVIEAVSRGLYQLVDLAPISNPDLVAVAAQFHEALLRKPGRIYFDNPTTLVPPHTRAKNLQRLQSPE